jgi:hypothetical protein
MDGTSSTTSKMNSNPNPDRLVARRTVLAAGLGLIALTACGGDPAAGKSSCAAFDERQAQVLASATMTDVAPRLTPRVEAVLRELATRRTGPDGVGASAGLVTADGQHGPELPLTPRRPSNCEEEQLGMGRLVAAPVRGNPRPAPARLTGATRRREHHAGRLPQPPPWAHERHQDAPGDQTGRPTTPKPRS